MHRRLKRRPAPAAPPHTIPAVTGNIRVIVADPVIRHDMLDTLKHIPYIQ